jgi:transposase-like protein
MLYVRWYLKCSLSYRDLEEMMAERGLSVDHFTVSRWVRHFPATCVCNALGNSAPAGPVVLLRFL